MLEDIVALGADQSETIYSFIQQLLSNGYLVPDTVVYAGLQGQMIYIHVQPSYQWRRKTRISNSTVIDSGKKKPLVTVEYNLIWRVQGRFL